MISSAAGEIMKFAVRLEGIGERFYRDVVNHLLDGSIKDIFNQLANEEAMHKNIFEKLVSTAGTFKSTETYPVEYLEYFYNYLDNKVIFSNEAKSRLSESFDILDAFDIAIQMELDSVMFYQELKPFVPVEGNKTIEKIIVEERKHFIKLSEAKKEPDIVSFIA